jgi:hypothetical protein
VETKLSKGAILGGDCLVPIVYPEGSSREHRPALGGASNPDVLRSAAKGWAAMRTGWCVMLLGALLFLGHAANAEDQYVVGDRLEAIELPDQHGKVRRVDESTKVIVFVSDKFASEVLKNGFSDLEAGDLASRGVVYITNLGELTLLVENLFVVPGMRRRPYAILLDKGTAETTARLPVRGGQVTLVFLEDQVVKRIEYAKLGDQVRALLGFEAAKP